MQIARPRHFIINPDHCLQFQQLQIAEVFVGGTFWTQTLTATAELSDITLKDDGKGLYVIAKSANTTTTYDSPPASVAILGDLSPVTFTMYSLNCGILSLLIWSLSLHYADLILAFTQILKLARFPKFLTHNHLIMDTSSVKSLLLVVKLSKYT